MLCLIPVFYHSLELRVSLYSLMTTTYGVLTTLEFWRNRRQLEVAYLPALTLTLLHTAFYCVRSVVDQAFPLDQALTGDGEGVPMMCLPVLAAKNSPVCWQIPTKPAPSRWPKAFAAASHS